MVRSRRSSRKARKPDRTISLKQFKREQKAKRREAGIRAEKRAVARASGGRQKVVFKKTTAAGRAARAARGETGVPQIQTTVERKGRRSGTTVIAGRAFTDEELFQRGVKKTTVKGVTTTTTSTVEIPTTGGTRVITLTKKTRRQLDVPKDFLRRKKDKPTFAATGNILVDQLTGRVSKTIGGTTIKTVQTAEGKPTTRLARRTEVVGGLTIAARSQEAERESFRRAERQAAKRAGGTIRRVAESSEDEALDLAGEGLISAKRARAAQTVLRSSVIRGATLGIKGERIQAVDQTGVSRRALEFVANDPLSAAGIVGGGVGLVRAGVTAVSTAAVRGAAKAAAKKAAATAVKATTKQLTRQGVTSGVKKGVLSATTRAANSAAQAAARQAALDASRATAQRLAGTTTKEAIKRASLSAAKRAATNAAKQAATTAANQASNRVLAKAAQTAGTGIGRSFLTRTAKEAASAGAARFVGITPKAPFTSVGQLAAGRLRTEAGKLPILATTGFRTAGAFGGATFAAREIAIGTTGVRKPLVKQVGGEKEVEFIERQANIAAERISNQRGLVQGALLDLPGAQSVTKGFGVSTGEERAFKASVRAQAKERGLSEAAGKELSEELARRRVITDVGEAGAFVLSSAAVERGGRAVIGREFAFLSRAGTTIKAKPVSGRLALIGLKELAPLGFVEATVQEGKRAERKTGVVEGKQVLQTGLIGAGTAGVLGGAIVGTAGKRGIQKGLNIAVNIIDPFEGLGDVTEDILERSAKRVGVRGFSAAGIITTGKGKGRAFTFSQGKPKGIALTQTNIAAQSKQTSQQIAAQSKAITQSTSPTAVKGVSFVPSATVSPSFTFGITPTKTKTPAKGQTLIPVPSRTQTPSVITTETIVPTDTFIPSETFIPSPVVTETPVPVTTETIVPSFTPVPTATPILRAPPPLFPPIFPPASGAGAGTVKGKKVKFVDELAAAQGLLAGSLGLKQARKPAKKKMKGKKKKAKKKGKVKRKAVRADQVLNIGFPKIGGLKNRIF